MTSAKMINWLDAVMIGHFRKIGYATASFRLDGTPWNSYFNYLDCRMLAKSLRFTIDTYTMCIIVLFYGKTFHNILKKNDKFTYL